MISLHAKINNNEQVLTNTFLQYFSIMNDFFVFKASSPSTYSVIAAPQLQDHSSTTIWFGYATFHNEEGIYSANDTIYIHYNLILAALYPW